MEYARKDLEMQALNTIREQELIFFTDVVAHLPCSRSTFYSYQLHKLDTLKKALEENRSRLKLQLRRKWAESDNPTVQIALYKLIASPEELERLSNQKITINADGATAEQKPTIDLDTLSKEELKVLKKILPEENSETQEIGKKE